MWGLYNLIHFLLKPPPNLPDPTKWRPEYENIAIVLAAGVFSVWAVRLCVQLFLSNVHLLTDASERVVMAKTYLSMLRKPGSIKDEDRAVILHALFRPAATGVVKDDGIPLSILELVTKHRQ